MFIGLHHQKWALWENPPNISSWMATGNRGARHHFNPHKQITDRPHLKSRPVGVIDMGGEREGGRGVSVLCGWMQWIGSRSTTRAGGRAMGRTWPASDKTKRRAAYSMLLAASPAPPPPTPVLSAPWDQSPWMLEPCRPRSRHRSWWLSVLNTCRLWGFSSNRWWLVVGSNPRVTVCHTSYNITGTCWNVEAMRLWFDDTPWKHSPGSKHHSTVTKNWSPCFLLPRSEGMLWHQWLSERPSCCIRFCRHINLVPPPTRLCKKTRNLSIYLRTFSTHLNWKPIVSIHLMNEIV